MNFLSFHKNEIALVTETHKALIIHRKCHGCWCPGHASSHVISGNGIGWLCLKYHLRRKNKIKSTWTHDLKIWIRDNNDQKTEITTESDLDFIVSQSEPLPPPPPPLPPTDTRTVPETPYTTPRPSPARSLSWSEESLDSFHGFGTEASLGNLPSNPYWLYLNDRYTFQLDIQHICVPFICQTDAYTLCFHFHFVCIFMFIFPKLAFFNRKLINHGTDVNDGAYFASNHG